MDKLSDRGESRELESAFFEDGNTRVGVLPQFKEVFICGPRFRGIALQSVSTRESKMG
jgi:hypothetical protein